MTAEFEGVDAGAFVVEDDLSRCVADEADERSVAGGVLAIEPCFVFPSEEYWTLKSFGPSRKI